MDVPVVDTEVTQLELGALLFATVVSVIVLGPGGGQSGGTGSFLATTLQLFVLGTFVFVVGFATMVGIKHFQGR